MSTASNEERNEMHASGLWSMEKYSYVHKVGLNGLDAQLLNRLKVAQLPRKSCFKGSWDFLIQF